MVVIIMLSLWLRILMLGSPCCPGGQIQDDEQAFIRQVIMMLMDISQNVDLKQYSTMRLGGKASYLADVHDRHEVSVAFDWAATNKLPVIMIGGGSNIFWSDAGFQGLVLVNKIMRFEQQDEDAENSYLTIGAGENWDSVVQRSVAAGLTGIEALSLIPGTAGATPIQNVGAYGQEIADTLVSIEAFDTASRQFITIPSSDCGFGYRTSRFKTSDRGKFFITGLTLHLTKGQLQPPFYPSLEAYLKEHAIAQITPQTIRDAVIAIRNSKLPDPAKVANNGSFFANPIVDDNQLIDLRAHYPNLQFWQLDNGKSKISAAWLVEQAGFKNAHDDQTGMATWPAQPLVLVNEHAKNTADLLAFKQKITDKIQSMFDISLQQEPEQLGTIT
ncbi:MAG: UDP-N-acetylmuramate dehydrogenase [Candidatus Saccharimonadales bacterium]